jgi:hypothetical protein
LRHEEVGVQDVVIILLADDVRLGFLQLEFVFESLQATVGVGVRVGGLY